MNRPQSLVSLLAALGLTLMAAPHAGFAQDSFADDVTRSRAPARNQTQVPVPPPSRDSGTSRPPPTPSHSQTPPAADAPATSDLRFAQVETTEAEEFGVPAVDQLRSEPMHAPTPTRIPGGLVVTTEALHGLYEKNQGAFIVFDVLAGPQGLPGAQNARPAGAGGSFTDQTQREFGNYLQSVTHGNKQVPLVFYCQSIHCWMSYNAALRAIKLGYTQVLWYRGGIEAWQQAGLPTYDRNG